MPQARLVVRRQLKRRYVLAFFEKLSPCLVGIEACASSHHWSRELQALGHTVRLMPPAYVKPYVKRQKETTWLTQRRFCEAVTRAKHAVSSQQRTPEQQSGLMLHPCAPSVQSASRTAVINANPRPILASSGLSPRSDAMVSRNFSKSSPIQVTSAFPR